MRRRLTLAERVARRGVQMKDCRTCRHFEPSSTGLAYGWCGAHRQYVKLYHPPGAFWSQCQFKSLSKSLSGDRAV